ncbi:hypothetical protein D3C81_1999560 [compost metagenome]
MKHDERFDFQTLCGDHFMAELSKLADMVRRIALYARRHLSNLGELFNRACRQFSAFLAALLQCSDQFRDPVTLGI